MADAAGPPRRAETFVRLALPRDVEAVAAIQARAWQSAYAGVLPGMVLDRLEPSARATWQLAVEAPPTDAHHVLVALAADRVVGFAAVCPSEDPTDDPHVVGSLAVLAVDPDARGQGHGSRLLAAAVETLRTSRLVTATCWLPHSDVALRTFLESAGWAPDGGTRELDTGAGIVRELRLHTRLD
jgi:GNAT superfamily N-acetyltransferase